ncbi:DUF4339 domain-containing protein [Tissierella sp. MB52-C2]|uniref:DUF4339 domain-containing protein n=1 Tax=Tissierella sp. MB52-C2 TaxID=3070999 RepID=UPI00280B452C|nr:DUF4339 domain-containing protein [Tissierella sp. MB52-C2]WMM26657.1 DUF4339 domain-containing protein [Tissierella sp. MB52-C2]
MDNKIWFYNDWFQVYGPFDKEEIIKLLNEKKIKKDYHLWHIGLDDWVCIKDIDVCNYVYPENYQSKNTFKGIPEFNPSIFKEKRVYDYDKGKSSIKIAGILLVLVGALWGINSLTPMLSGVYYSDATTYLTLGWNAVASIVTIIIGLQVSKIKSWSYSWGIGIAVVNLITDLINVRDNGANFKLFFIPIYLGIAFLLLSNERIFKESEIEKTTN